MVYKEIIGATCAFLVFATFGADAALIGRLPATPGGTDYQAYYDDILDVTWGADANWAKTAGLSDDGVIDGEISWDTAVSSLASLSINGVTGWRLPSLDVNGDGVVVSCDGASVSQEACKDNELEHLYFYGGSTVKRGVDSLYDSEDPFINLEPDYYWTGTPCQGNDTCKYAFGMFTFNGSLVFSNKANDHHIIAVYSGDVNAAVVPIPAAIWLFGSGLIGLIGVARRKKYC